RMAWIRIPTLSSATRCTTQRRYATSQRTSSASSRSATRGGKSDLLAKCHLPPVVEPSTDEKWQFAGRGSMSDAYAAAGVDTRAGDLAVELMKAAVAKTHGQNVIGGVG